MREVWNRRGLKKNVTTFYEWGKKKKKRVFGIFSEWKSTWMRETSPTGFIDYWIFFFCWTKREIYFVHRQKCQPAAPAGHTFNGEKEKSSFSSNSLPTFRPTSWCSSLPAEPSQVLMVRMLDEGVLVTGQITIMYDTWMVEAYSR